MQRFAPRHPRATILMALVVAVLSAQRMLAQTTQLRLIANLGNGLCLQPMPSDNQYTWGLPIVQEPCNGDPSQRWYMVWIGDGTIPGYGGADLWQFVNAKTAQCMDNRDGSLLDGGIVQQWPCGSSTTMVWGFGLGYELRNQRSGKCLDVAGGSPAPGNTIWQFHCTSTLYAQNYAQYWSYPLPPITITAPIGPRR